jgi:hypothetical protein
MKIIRLLATKAPQLGFQILSFRAFFSMLMKRVSWGRPNHNQSSIILLEPEPYHAAAPIPAPPLGSTCKYFKK